MITTADLLRVLPDDPTILEAGAHHGEDTIVLAKHAAHVYAFEPVPLCFMRAHEATLHLPNVSMFAFALADSEDALAKMYVSQGKDDASSSLLRPADHYDKYPHISFDEDPIDVRVTTIEAWAEDNQVSCIDGMWLDTQGTELAILQSAGEILETVQAVMVEFSLTQLYHAAPLWPEVQNWLEEQGFCVINEYRYPGDYAGEALVAR